MCYKKCKKRILTAPAVKGLTLVLTNPQLPSKHGTSELGCFDTGQYTVCWFSIIILNLIIGSTEDIAHKLDQVGENHRYLFNFKPNIYKSNRLQRGDRL